MPRPVRTRIAPSPTGDPHVGTAYIALFNLCFARAHTGQFILRIEDTDQQRSTADSERQILDALRWLGLDWDEGPDVGGEFGPYRQSERSEIYQAHARQLVEAGKAFYCFRSPDELEAIREERKAAGFNPGIKGDLALPAEEVQRRLAAGEPHVIRMKVPDSGVCHIKDRLRGDIAIEWSQVDCQVLLKSDGLPTYHLANVVDDHLMQITHVIRGEEWIPSAPKHALLYEYFGWEMPELCHMPLLRNADKSKLSKRKNPTSIRFYERLGLLPEALLNYLGRMGWSMPDEREKFSLDEMVAEFDLDRVSLGGPVFDPVKLKWLNGLWLREALSDAEFLRRLLQWGLNEEAWAPLVPLLKGRVETFSDAIPASAFMFNGVQEQPLEAYSTLRLPAESRVEFLQYALWRLEKIQDWQQETLFATLKQVAAALELKLGDAMKVIFVAVAGTVNSWSVVHSMEILGPDLSRARLRVALEAHGGVSKKQMKRFEKRFAQLFQTT